MFLIPSIWLSGCRFQYIWCSNIPGKVEKVTGSVFWFSAIRFWNTVKFIYARNPKEYFHQSQVHILRKILICWKYNTGWKYKRTKRVYAGNSEYKRQQVFMIHCIIFIQANGKYGVLSLLTPLGALVMRELKYSCNRVYENKQKGFSLLYSYVNQLVGKVIFQNVVYFYRAVISIVVLYFHFEVIELSLMLFSGDYIFPASFFSFYQT